MGGKPRAKSVQIYPPEPRPVKHQEVPQEMRERWAAEDARAPTCECSWLMRYMGQEKVSDLWQRYAYKCPGCGAFKAVMRQR